WVSPFRPISASPTRKSVLNKLRVHPDFVAPFSPPAKGPHPPHPWPPPLQGGEKDRSLARSFDRAQQKRTSRNRPSTVNTNLSRLQPLDFKTHYTGNPKSSKTRRKWLTICSSEQFTAANACPAAAIRSERPGSFQSSRMREASAVASPTGTSRLLTPSWT